MIQFVLQTARRTGALYRQNWDIFLNMKVASQVMQLLKHPQSAIVLTDVWYASFASSFVLFIQRVTSASCARCYARIQGCGEGVG
jgi:hypothetical protein